MEQAKNEARAENTDGLNDTERSIRELEKEISTIKNRINELNQLTRFPEYFKSKIHKLNKTGLFRIAPDIAFGIYDKIDNCDVFIVIGRTFSQYRKWLEFEMLAAQGLGKPIVAVIPNLQDTPRELMFYCDEIVNWGSSDSHIKLGESLNSVIRKRRLIPW